MGKVTPREVFSSVYEAVRREFGSAAEVETVHEDATSRTFGFTVDGVDYSLMVNVTP